VRLFHALAALDENFRSKYLISFVEGWLSFLDCRGNAINYFSLFLTAKDFISDYFNGDSALIQEIDLGNFGIKKIKSEPPVIFSKIHDKFLRDQIISRALLPEKNVIKVFLTNGTNEEVIPSTEKKLVFRPMPSFEVEKNQKIKRIKGITIEHRSHRIKNNKSKIHYNYDDQDITAHLDEFALAVLNHQILEDQKGCKTFKISWKNGEVKIRPGTNFKKKKVFIANIGEVNQ
jgi:hypothetical protein